ncbi:phosphotransferase [Streptantibioticus ferralitis]|uniref:Phosphotransferase n=1 Tax=Streptantibioticus ferralitis TaxID=236510 RepID=A0ABT5ZA96_9ACTN|nr:phosphotransferase [Streptantibioticus ferralitis]MDF2260476.1 phosphotransferase [Streptantibioticus ferralitis]
MHESSLPGGFINQVVRVGATVRRPASPRAPFVRELLKFFEQCGWAGAPRFLGLDEEGREVFNYIDGYVAWRADQRLEACSDDNLVRVARLVREFHDLSCGSSLAGPREVVCHNDLSPKNTVYATDGVGWQPLAFIDWDLAAPGDRIHDVAHVCWQYLDLGPRVTDLSDAARRTRLICDAYGLVERERIVDTILWWQDRCWRGIETAAASGELAMIRLRDQGAVDEVRAAYRWVSAHRPSLEVALR